jgi:hypothetical protein
MSEHLHGMYVVGCFRCELSRMDSYDDPIEEDDDE